MGCGKTQRRRCRRNKHHPQDIFGRASRSNGWLDLPTLRRWEERKTTHGMTASGVVSGKSPEAHSRLLADLEEEFQADTVLESELVAIVRDSLWQLTRARRIEAELLAPERPGLEGASELGLAFLANQATIATLLRYKGTATRGLYKALHQLERMAAARAGEHVAPPGRGRRRSGCDPGHWGHR